MPPTGATAQQYAPHDSAGSYSSMPQHVHQHQSHPQASGHRSQRSQKTQRTHGQHQPVHSGRLIYADPRSLPSYPTIGLKDDNASSAAAAALYNTSTNERNQQHAVSLQTLSNAATTRSTTTAAYTAVTQTKSPPPIFDNSGPVNPNSLKAATAAASAALYTPAPPTPEPAPTLSLGSAIMERPPTPKNSTNLADIGSTAGSSMTAANLAAGSAASRRRHQRNPSRETTFSTSGNRNSIASSTASAWGNSAANQAFKYSQDAAAASKASMASERPIPEVAALGPHPSLRAAKGAMRAASIAGSSGQAARSQDRSVSNPAVFRHKKSFSSHYPESSVAASPTANALSAATIAHGARPQSSRLPEGGAVPYTTMNRQMYTSNPPVASEATDKNHEDGLHASAVAMAKRMYNPKTGTGTTEIHRDSLQEAAYKLAQERLDRLHLEHEKGRGYRDHYMDPKMTVNTPAAPEEVDDSRRFSIRGKLRRRRSSNGSEVSEDRKRSLEIPSQMTSRMSEADYEKRRKDRQSVIVAAQRNVQARLRSIDEQVYAQTGRVHPSLRSSWDSKARAAAQARATTRQSRGPSADQIDLGGGKFIDRTEVDRIASERVQPILDEINEKAETERERQAALKKEEDDRKTEAQMQKARGREMKLIYHKMKQDEKAAKKSKKAATKGAKASTNGANAADEDNSDTMTAPDLTEPEVEAAGVAAVASSSESTGEQQPQRRTIKALAFKASPARKTNATTSNGTASGGSRLSKLFARPPKLNMSNLRKKDEPQSPQTSRGETVGPPGPAYVPGASTVPVAEDAIGASGAIVAAGAAAEATGDDLSPTDRTTTSKSTNSPVSPVSPVSPFSPQSENDSSATPSPSKVKTWLKSRFNRPRSKSSASVSGISSGTAALSTEQAHSEKPFVGGHALTNSTDNAGVKSGSAAAHTAGGVAGLAIGGAAVGTGVSSLAAADDDDSVIAHPDTSLNATQNSHTTAAAEAAETIETGGGQYAAETTAPDTSRFADELNAELNAIPTHDVSAAQVDGTTPVHETFTTQGNEPSTEKVITTGPVSERASTPPLGGPVENVGPDNFTWPPAEGAGISGETGTGTVATAATDFAPATPVGDVDVESTQLESDKSVLPVATDVASGETENKGALTPPRSIRDPAQRKTPSPVRDSRFLENLAGSI